MILSKFNLKNINRDNISVPSSDIFELPEKVLQFGTGVLLRGLPDYFINKANNKGIFNGRIVVVKSTSQGDAGCFSKQDGLYTQCVRGIENNQVTEENYINASISRVLSAQEDWDAILKCAHDQNIQVIISNTTEVGIQLVKEDIQHHPPVSFPGKLLAFLYERYKAFNGSDKCGLVIIPTELIVDNGKKLESIVLELAHLNGLNDDFIEWLERSNYFCNSLVDRIVPGKPDDSSLKDLEKTLGYEDQLMIMSEVYRLWAIEGGSKIKDILSFAKADNGVIIENNIDIYRELKLRLLNGTHTLSCGLAFLSGFDTVKESMDNEEFYSFISGLMLKEIAPSIPYEIDKQVSYEFGTKVLDRFRNPFIKHHWLSITMQYSSKMKMRCIPVLTNHYQKFGAVPNLFSFGFAAYLYFMKAVTIKEGRYYGDLLGQPYLINDDQAPVFYKRWAGLSVVTLVKEVLSDQAFWGEDLTTLDGFQKAVTDHLNLMMDVGINEALESVIQKKAIVK
jgi:tagaturonate reductase